MRHSPFKINPLARERWLLHMRAAVDSLNLPQLQAAELWAYLDRAATAMLNTYED
jgi:hemoglobin